jgi:trk system potassium uptake protein TrkH
MKLFNSQLIVRILSTILLIETIAFLACIPVAVIYKDSFAPFLWSAGISFFLSTIFLEFSKKADPSRFSNRDGYLMVTVAWLLFLSMGALPYLFSGTIRSFTDAFFESSSGFTATGATVYPNVEILPHSILFWRSLTHWIGGMGIIALVIIILPSLKLSGYQLFTLESSLREKIHPKTKAIGFRILVIYIALTIAEIILLSLGDMSLFDSICHSFGTVATGGFSTKNTSLISFSAYSQYIVMIFMFLAGVSMVVYYYIIKLNFRKILQNEELWFYTILTIISGTIITSIILVNSDSTIELAFRKGFFNVISIITTTGYASADFLHWSGPALMLIFLLLFTGACTGSTAGGIKAARHLVVLKSVKAAFVKLIHPNAVPNIRFNGKVISEKTSVSIVSFVILYLFIFIAGTVMVVISGLDVVSAASSVAASLGNTGPGLGTVGPLSNFSQVPQTTKIILSVLMIIGRVEIITILSLFTRSFWRL